MWFSFSVIVRAALALIHKSLTQLIAIKYAGNYKTKFPSCWKEDRMYPWVWLFPPIWNTRKKTWRGRIKSKRKRGRCCDSGLQHSITLNVYFVQLHSISFSSSVLVLNPVTTSEAGKWKENKPKPKENTVPRVWRLWGTCSPKHLEMLLTAAADALPYLESRQSFNKMETASACCPPAPRSFLM